MGPNYKELETALEMILDQKIMVPQYEVIEYWGVMDMNMLDKLVWN